MIRYIRGIVTDMEENCIILENQGVGYRIFMPAAAMGGHVRLGEEMKIHTYMSVREDAMLLFGFLTRDDLRLFELLIGVSGIGPKGGLGILSALSAAELRFAILSDDAASIARAPGIGKKTAQKLILELKDKLDLGETLGSRPVQARQAEAYPSGDSVQEAVMALTALGYPGTEALRAVKAVEGREGMDTEQLLKAALKHLV